VSKSQDYNIHNFGGIYPFIASLSGQVLQEAPHVNNDATSITIFILFITEEIQRLVTKTNK
jgi:hypothetical protein